MVLFTMRRKIIRQGTGSYTITLPKEWVEAHGLHESANPEIDLLEEKNSITLSTKAFAEEKSVTIPLSRTLYNSSLWYLILSAYLSGYQEIRLLPQTEYCVHIDRISYKKSKVAIVKELQDLMPLLIGMEIIKQTKNEIVLRELASSNPERFVAMLNRAFYILENTIQESHQAIIQKEKEKVLLSVFAQGGMNKLHQYCLRLLQQFGYEDAEKTIFVARLLTAMDNFSGTLKIVLRSKNYSVKEAEHLSLLADYLGRTRSSLQKKDVALLVQVMQEVKDQRVELKSAAMKSCYDTLNEIIRHCMEIVI